MNPPTDGWIEDALDTYPLAETPPNFSASVMRRVHAANARAVAAALPRFGLTWIDLALGFFLALFIATVFVVWSLLPEQAVLHIELQWLQLSSGRFEPVLAVSLLAGGLLLLLALLFSVNLLVRGRENFRL